MNINELIITYFFAIHNLIHRFSHKNASAIVTFDSGDGFAFRLPAFYFYHALDNFGKTDGLTTTNALYFLHIIWLVLIFLAV